MKNRSVAPMWAAKLGYAVMSAVCCVIGVLLIRNPGGAAALGRALGAALTAFGGVKLVGYFSRDLFRLAFQYDLEFGILLIALGTAVLLKPEESLDFFLTALGTAALADGLFKIRIARDARRFGIESWWMILLLAGAAGAAGLVLVLRPWESARMLAALLGVTLLAEGILSLWVVLSTVKIVPNQRPDVVEGTYSEVTDSGLYE